MASTCMGREAAHLLGINFRSARASGEIPGTLFFETANIRCKKVPGTENDWLYFYLGPDGNELKPVGQAILTRTAAQYEPVPAS